MGFTQEMVQSPVFLCPEDREKQTHTGGNVP